MLAIPLVTVLGVPMYVNAETFFSTSAALLETGVGTGSVMAPIVTNMGVRVPEVALLASLFLWRLVAALVASVFAVAVRGGVLFALALGWSRKVVDLGLRRRASRQPPLAPRLLASG